MKGNLVLFNSCVVQFPVLCCVVLLFCFILLLGVVRYATILRAQKTQRQAQTESGSTGREAMLPPAKATSKEQYGFIVELELDIGAGIVESHHKEKVLGAVSLLSRLL